MAETKQELKLNRTGGFAAISPELPTNKPFAIPRMVRGNDGMMHTVFVDARTGQQVGSLNDYTILSAGNNYYDPNGTNTNQEPNESNIFKVLKKNGPGGQHDAVSPLSGDNSGRNVSNNFGYIDQPNALKYATLMPGVPGIAARAVKVGLGVNNVAAVNAARSMLGLPDNGVKSVVKGAVIDNQGQISNNAQIGNNNYSIGLDAMSPNGATNLTPNEARNRALTLGTGVTENPGYSNGKKTTSQGIIGKALDRVFGSETPNTPSSVVTTSPANVAPNYNNAGSFTPSPNTVGTGVARAPSQVTKNTPSAGSDVGFTAAFGSHRPNMPDNGIVDAVKNSVGQTFGKGYSVKGISGTEGGSLAQFGSPRHKTGKALDFDVVDPSGKKVTDKNALNDLASNFAYANPNAGVGFGEGYMTDENGLPGRMHLDISGYGKQWGAKNLGANMDDALFNSEDGSGTIPAARAGYRPTPFSNAPTPVTRPAPAPQGFVSQDERNMADFGPSLNPIANTLSDVSKQTAAQKSISKAINSGTENKTLNETANKLGLTPGKLANMGLTARTPQEKAQIAKAIAGELGPDSLKALAQNDPTARAELANIAASIENRAATTKYANDISRVLDPSQYNSMAAANLGTTNNNLNLYGDSLNKAIDDFYTGKLNAPTPGTTSYYNPDIVSPDWGAQMANPTNVGNHVFGSLPEYSPSQVAKNRMNAFAMSDINNFAGKAKDNVDMGRPGAMTSPGFGAGSRAAGVAAERSTYSAPSSSSSQGFGSGSRATGVQAERSTSGGMASSNTGKNTSQGFGSGSRAAGVAAERSTGSTSSKGSTGGGMNSSGSSKGSQSRSDGWT